MTVISYSSIDHFLKDNLHFLEKNEAANNLLIGIPMALKKVKDLNPYPILLSVFDEGIPVLVCIQTPPRNLLMTATEVHQSAATDTLIACLLEQDIAVPGVVARKSLATDFAEQWTAQTHQSWKVDFNQLIYRLDKLENISSPSGQLRLATMRELELLSPWIAAFLEEALNKKDEIEAKMLTIRNIENQKLYVWEDKEIVSMASLTRPTQHGIMVSYVYTPPKYRGKGYASAVVSELSALALKTYDFCALYTDLANPTSNKIYTRMGYCPIQESQQISFL